MSENDDIAYAFTPYKVLTSPQGVWPLQKYNTFTLIRSIICGSSMTMMMITLFLEIVFGNGNAYAKLDALMLMSCNILCVLKLLFFQLYAENLIRNFTSAVNDYLAIDTEEKRTIMRRHAFMGRMIFYSTLFFCYVASLFLSATTIVDDEDIQVNETMKNQISKLPLPITFLGDVHVPYTSLYLLICTAQYIILILNTNTNCGNDVLFLAITLHICGQMEILKIEFSNYGQRSKNLSEDFSVLVSRHCYLMEHTELLIDVISFVLFVQILFSCLLICIVGFQFILALKTHVVVIIIKTVIVLITLMLQLFCFNVVGDYLKCQMEEIAHSIYNCNWYNFPLKLMKNVSFVIMRSQQPIQLLAGKYFVVNIETYMTILKSSLSYLSVLRVMMDG